MALATTEKFEELALLIDTSTTATPTYERIAGLIDGSISRSASVDTAEVPDVDDESLPLSIERQVRSIEVKVSGTGVWAQESHGYLMNWFYSSSTKKIRISNLKAATGDTEHEEGEALLVTLDNNRSKGSKVEASISIEFNGTPTRTAKA